jgi:hypothetical protein
VPPQVLYFGATAAVLAFIWLAQGGGAIDKAPGQHEGGPGGDKRKPGGGAAPPPPTESPYSYGLNESPSPDQANPNGGTTDNTSTDGQTSSGPVVYTTATGYTTDAQVPSRSPAPAGSFPISPRVSSVFTSPQVVAAYQAASVAPSTAAATGGTIRSGGAF